MVNSGKRITVDGWLISERSYSLIQDSFRAVGLPQSARELAQGGWHHGSQSGSTHDGAGAWDLRVVNIPDWQIEPLIVELRKRAGLAVWFRDEEHGGFDGPHIHGITSDEDGLSDGARWQVEEAKAGRNGLSNRGKDYHPRPRWTPYVWPVTATGPEKEDDVFLFKSHANAEPDGHGIGQGAQWIVHSGHAFQVAQGATVSSSVPVVLSSTEAMDKAFMDSVIRHPLGG